MRRMFMNAIGLTMTALFAVAVPAAAQDFEWRGTVDSGDAVEVRGLNGAIEAVASSGRQVVVTAVKEEGRRGSAEDVRIEVVEHAGGVTICTVYPDERGERENRCAPGHSHVHNRDNDTRVDFRVEVPDGVNLEAGTVNGDVVVRRIAGDVKASTVNGDVDVESGGNAEASTVNGSIRAVIGENLQDDLHFSTVNGSVTVSLPAGADADVEASTVNGGLESDFPLTIRGRFSNRRMNGTIGDGGHTLRLETVNGGITIDRT